MSVCYHVVAIYKTEKKFIWRFPSIKSIPFSAKIETFIQSVILVNEKMNYFNRMFKIGSILFSKYMLKSLIPEYAF